MRILVSQSIPLRWLVLAVGFVCYAIAFVLWLELRPFDQATTRAVENAGGAVAPAIAALLFLRAALHTGARDRRPWLYLAAGCALWSAGDVIWTFYDVALKREVPFPSLADAGYLGGYPLLFCGLLGATAPGKRGLGWRTALDALAVVAAVGTALAALILEPTFHDSSVTLTTKVLSAAYPMADLALLFAVLVAMQRVRSRRGGIVLLLFSAGLALVLISDVLFAYLALDESYSGSSVIDVGWVIGYFLLGYGAVLHVEWQPVYGRTSRSGLSWRQLVPLAILPPMMGWLFSRRLELNTEAITGLFVFCFVGLLVVRQAVNFLDALALSRRLRRAYREASRARAELNRLNRRLLSSLALEQERATIDALTGVLNRSGISEELRAATEAVRECGGTCAVGVVDINSLKDVNDRFGHLAGDVYIQQVARALQGQSAKVGRYGGDEFVVILPGADVSSIRAYTRDVRTRLVTYHDRSIGPPHAMISVGFALCPQEGHNVDDLLRLADARMYVNKVEGHAAA